MTGEEALAAAGRIGGWMRRVVRRWRVRARRRGLARVRQRWVEGRALSDRALEQLVYGDNLAGVEAEAQARTLRDLIVKLQEIERIHGDLEVGIYREDKGWEFRPSIEVVGGYQEIGKPQGFVGIS